MAPVVGTFTTANYGGGYPYAPRVTAHNATGASALVVFVTSAGGYSWNPTATFAGVAMTMLARSTSTGGQGSCWIFGLADPPQTTGTVAIDKANEYGDLGVATAINVSGTGPAPFGETVAIHGNGSVTLDVDITGESLLLGAAHDHYTSGATMTTPAAATVIYSNKTNQNHQQFGFSKAQATAGNVSMTFSTAFNSIGAGLVAIRGPLPREAPKPSGALTVSKTGQYTDLKAFWAFNAATASPEPNLAQTPGALTYGANVANRSDSVGGYLDTFNNGTGKQGGTTTHTLAQMGIAAGQPFTVFLRLVPPQFNEGTDRTVFGFYGAGSYNFNVYGTIFEYESGGQFFGFGERPATAVQTLVMTYTPASDSMTVYKNGVLAGTHAGDFLDNIVGTNFSTRRLSVGWDANQDYFPLRERIYEAGIVLGAWTAEQAAAYDSNPLGMLGGAPVPVNYDLTVATLNTGDPVPGRPVLTTAAAPVNVALAVGSLDTTAPAPVRPVFSQGHKFATSALAPAAPTAARLALAQLHFLITDDLAGPPPVAGRPVAAQDHALVPLGLVSAAPEPGRPNLGQSHTLSALHQTTAEPVPDRPVLVQDHRLAGQDVTAPAPVAASVPVSQVHVLAASPVTTPAPVLGRPGASALVEIAVGDLIGPAPETGRPSLIQSHIYSVSDLIGSAPIIAPAALSQTHVLAAPDRTTPAPIVSSGPVSQMHRLVPAVLVVPPPDVPIVPFGGGHVVSAAGLTTPAPVAGTPAITQRHALTIGQLATAAVEFGSPAIIQAGQIIPAAVTTGGPTPGRPALTQVHALAAAELRTAAPVLGRPASGQFHPLETGDLDSPAPILGRPPLVARSSLSASSFTSPAPISDRPDLFQGHRVTAAAVLAPAASLSRPVLRQTHRLTILDLATGRPVPGLATVLTRLPGGEPRPPVIAAQPRPAAVAAASRPAPIAAQPRGFTVPRSDY